MVPFNGKLLGFVVCFADIFGPFFQELLYAHLREVLVFWLQFLPILI